MGTYRAFIVDKHDHVTEALILGAENDEAALKEAHQYLDRHDIEVWDAARLVARLPAQTKL